MAKRKAIKAALYGFLGTYTSRNSDDRGYWLLGQVHSSFQRCTIDLLGAAPEEDSPLEVARRLAIRRFGEQVRKSGLSLEHVREATLEVTMSPEVVRGRQGDCIVDGQMAHFTVRAVVDTGRAHEHTRTIFIAPHDPKKERRRSRSAWDTSVDVDRWSMGQRRSTASTILLGSIVYFSLVFSLGFALGIVRVIFLVPALGERWAELAEMPVMLLASWGCARWVVARFAIRSIGSYRLLLGFLALSYLVAAELLLVVFLRGESLAVYLADRDPVSGIAYVLSLLLFALLPWLAGGRGEQQGSASP